VVVRIEDGKGGWVQLTETVAVVGRHDNKGLVQNVELLELLDGGADRVVQLEQVTQGAVVVEGVHLLVDGGGLRHEEEALLATALVEDVNGLKRHLLQAGQVLGRAIGTRGVVLQRREVVGEDVAVEPDGEIALAEDAQRLLVVGSRQERRLVPADRVALLGELGVVVLALERAGAGQELLGTATKVDVGAVGLGPRVVADTVEGLVDQHAVLRAQARVAGQSNRGGVGDESGRDSAPCGALERHQQVALWEEVGVVAYPDAMQKLDNGLDLGVVKRVGRRVGVNAAEDSQLWGAQLLRLPAVHLPHSVHGALVAAVQGRGRVGAVGDEGVDRVRLLLSC
jgi:hypothetical protein